MIERGTDIMTVPWGLVTVCIETDYDPPDRSVGMNYGFYFATVIDKYGKTHQINVSDGGTVYDGIKRIGVVLRDVLYSTEREDHHYQRSI